MVHEKINPEEVDDKITTHKGDASAHHAVHLKTLADHPLSIIPDITPAKLDAVDSPADEEVATYNAATGKFEWKVPAGVTTLSALTIDVNKDWATKIIKNLGAPVDAGDAYSKGNVIDLADIPTITYAKLNVANSLLASDILSTEFNVASKLLKLDASALVPYAQIPQGIKEETASYTIFIKNSTIYAKNGATGELEFEGADAATVIQAAINALTGGRTWKEKVVLKGDFTISAQITLQSYLVLDLTRANLTLANDVDDEMLYATGKNHIEIIGGMLDGNKANQAAGLGVIFLSSCSDCKVTGIWLKDGYTDGVRASNSNRMKVLNSYFENCGTSGVDFYTYPVNIANSLDIQIKGVISNNNILRLNGVDRGTIENCVVYGFTEGASVLPILAAFNGRVEILNNFVVGGKGCIFSSDNLYAVIKGNIVTGAWQLDTGWGYGIGASSPSVVVGNIAYENANDGIVSEEYSKSVVGNFCFKNGRHGINVFNVSHGTIVGNVCYNNGAGEGGKASGILIGATTSQTRNIIADNLCYDDQGEPTQKYGVYEDANMDYDLIKDNILEGNVTAPIFKTGANTVILYNVGNNDAVAVVPTAPWTGLVYLDDGTNTGDTNPHYRYWDGAAWNDL